MALKQSEAEKKQRMAEIVADLKKGMDELEDLGKSSIAQALLSANIFFWLDTGYFDGESNLKPLLHTWSLAVEEQFYLFFPLL